MPSLYEGMSFPGFVAALPIVGTVLLIGCSGNNQSIDRQSRSERLLSHSFLIFIGKMSYSLYLWHWPIYCFVDYSLYSQSSIVRATLKVSLTILCSFASYHWIEKPIRSYHRFTRSAVVPGWRASFWLWQRNG